jgi:hypothetical protein
MAKIKEVELWEGRRQFHYFCKGCNEIHAFSLKSEEGNHTFNMDLNNPTVNPSLLQNFGGQSKICHSYIRNGEIQYLGDCQHELAGKTIQLPEID